MEREGEGERSGSQLQWLYSCKGALSALLRVVSCRQKAANDERQSRQSSGSRKPLRLGLSPASAMPPRLAGRLNWPAPVYASSN